MKAIERIVLYIVGGAVAVQVLGCLFSLIALIALLLGSFYILHYVIGVFAP